MRQISFLMVVLRPALLRADQPDRQPPSLTRRTRPQPAAAPANCRWQGRASHDCCGHATQWPPSSSRGARSVHGSSHPYRSGRWQPTSLVGIHVEEVDVACTLAGIIKVRQDCVHHLTNQRPLKKYGSLLVYYKERVELKIFFTQI